mmetsp:Transcript_16179/g.25062  ORF Transcript_16179/g.25062 Transcript_16179/m.25062 type:complete len:109 (-) Transcript_16179:1080-1406(-)
MYNETITGNGELYLDRKKFFSKLFFLEVAVLLVCPLPMPQNTDFCLEFEFGGHRVDYYFSEFQTAFMWIRIFFLIRSIFNYSIYTDAYSKKLCKTYGFSAGVRFTFKC